MSDEKSVVMRDERGKLLPGSKLAAGTKNPTASQVTILKNAMMSAVTADTMVEMTNRLIDLCRSSDGKTALAALELFLNRILGKPKESIEMDLRAETTSTVPVASALDASDLAALENMRRKLTNPSVIDAEVIVEKEPNG